MGHLRTKCYIKCHKNGKLTTIKGNQIKYGFGDNIQNEDGLIATIDSDHQKHVNLFKNPKH